jgi:hypothetical protein
VVRHRSLLEGAESVPHRIIQGRELSSATLVAEKVALILPFGRIDFRATTILLDRVVDDLRWCRCAGEESPIKTWQHNAEARGLVD